MMYILIYGMLLHVAHLSVCPHPCYAWHSRETHPVGPAIAEEVCARCHYSIRLLRLPVYNSFVCMSVRSERKVGSILIHQ